MASITIKGTDFPIRFWRTKSGLECDFVLGLDGDVAIEVKGTDNVQPRDLKGLAAYMQEHQPRSAIVVCNETMPRRTAGGIRLLPWRDFLERLWDGRIVE